MNTFVSAMLLWAVFIGFIIWPVMRRAGAAVRWISVLLVAGGYGACFYVWKVQQWISPAVGIMRVLEPVIPNN